MKDNEQKLNKSASDQKKAEAFPYMARPAVEPGSEEDVQSLSLEFFKTRPDKDWVFSKLKYPSALLFLRILSHVCKEE